MTSIRMMLLSLVLATWSNSSVASIMTYSFIHEGFSEGAVVTGSFTIDDIDGDGLGLAFTALVPYELLDFEMSFSGNSLVNPFSLFLPDVHGFVYQYTDGPEWGDSTGIQPEGIAVGSQLLPTRLGGYWAGKGPLFGSDGGYVSDGFFTDTSDQNAFVESQPIPLPSTLWAMLLSLAAMVRIRCGSTIS